MFASPRLSTSDCLGKYARICPERAILRSRAPRRLHCRAAQDSGSELKITRRGVVNGVYLGLSAYLTYDLVQDLGLSVGDNAQPVPQYEGIQGVGSIYKVATFAGGCFWCMEPAFDKLGAGVIGTISGYTGGPEENPTYLQVSGKETHHKEAVQVVYDPTIISYEKLLDAFWHSVDPTQDNGQFVDIGPQYATAIYCYDDEQLKAAEASKSKLQAAGVFGEGKPIVTEVVDASELPFWPAEKYHQNYYKNRSMRYKLYRSLSGRDDFIQSIWGPEYLFSK